MQCQGTSHTTQHPKVCPCQEIPSAPAQCMPPSAPLPLLQQGLALCCWDPEPSGRQSRPQPPRDSEERLRRAILSWPSSDSLQPCPGTVQGGTAADCYMLAVPVASLLSTVPPEPPLLHSPFLAPTDQLLCILQQPLAVLIHCALSLTNTITISPARIMQILQKELLLSQSHLELSVLAQNGREVTLDKLLNTQLHPGGWDGPTGHSKHPGQAQLCPVG